MKSSFKKTVTALLAAALLAAAPCTPVFGAQTYYVNDGSSTLTMADAYAIGASGEAAKLTRRLHGGRDGGGARGKGGEKAASKKAERMAAVDADGVSVDCVTAVV